MDTASLEIALTDCFTKIIDLCSQQNKDSNVVEILYQGLRLFELDELLTDLFGEEIKARKKNDEGICMAVVTYANMCGVRAVDRIVENKGC